MAVVRDGFGHSHAGGLRTIPGTAGGRSGGELWYRPIPQVEASLRAEAPVRIGTALLGHASPPDQFSFPSGHTITAFAVAVSLGSFYPALFPGLLFCALSVALSRILLGMHFLSDVVAGGVLGAILGYTSAILFHILPL